MDEDWVLNKDCLISAAATTLHNDDLDLACLDADVKSEPADEFDYLGSSAGSPSSSLSSPDMKDQLGVDLSFCVPFSNNNPFLNSPASSSGSPFGMVFPACSGGPSPLPPVSHFSQSQMNMQMNEPQSCVPGSIGFNGNDALNFFEDDRSPSPPSDRSSPTDRIPSMLNIVYEAMPDSFGHIHNGIHGLNSLAAAQQQLKTRSKMHEMAVKQRLITDQDPRSQGMVQLSAEERRTLVQEGYPVPTRLPLTKSEEEALKIVRRKIKNKLSAQESRRKRKEYMDTLEQRCQGYFNENTQLKARLRQMEMANKQMSAQVKKLQEMMGVSE